MKLADGLYFAPSVQFRNLSFSRDTLPSQFNELIRGYYLDPARALNGDSQAFASGLVLVSCIDAMALVETGLDKDVGLRFVTWVLRHLPGFSNIDDAVLLYKDFRNGLVHESRVKNGSQFSLCRDKVAFREDGILVVNPSLLANEVERALDDFIDRLKTDDTLWMHLKNYVERSFKRELQLTKEK